MDSMTATQRIAQAWASYVRVNGLKQNTQTYHKAMHAFVNGCNALCPDGLPPIIQIYIMAGRDLLDLPQPEAESA